MVCKLHQSLCRLKQVNDEDCSTVILVLYTDDTLIAEKHDMTLGEIKGKFTILYYGLLDMPSMFLA